METNLDEYQDQIEDWMETVCEMEFGNPTDSDPESKEEDFRENLS